MYLVGPLWVLQDAWSQSYHALQLQSIITEQGFVFISSPYLYCKMEIQK